MDRNTLVGFGIIGVILAVFTFMNQPSEEEIQAQKEKMELAEKRAEENRKLEEEQSKESNKEIEESTNTIIPKVDEKGEVVIDSQGRVIYTDTVKKRDTII